MVRLLCFPYTFALPDKASEAPWGADPLEYDGGFQALRYDPDAWYRGSLVPGANVPWTVFNARDFKTSDDASALTLEVNFGEVDWSFHQKVYGWSALQYQAWARGYIEINGPATEDVVLYTDGLLEFNIDGIPYFGGDFYSQRRAPAVLHLEPGRHQLDLRLTRDVRAMGGIDQPSIEVKLEARISEQPLELSEDGILISDVVSGKFVSSLGSITIRNNVQNDLKVIGIQSTDVSLD